MRWLAIKASGLDLLACFRCVTGFIWIHFANAQSVLPATHSFLKAAVASFVTHLKLIHGPGLLLVYHCGTILTWALVADHATEATVLLLTPQLVALWLDFRLASDLLPWWLHVSPRRRSLLIAKACAGLLYSLVRRCREVEVFWFCLRLYLGLLCLVGELCLPLALFGMSYLLWQHVGMLLTAGKVWYHSRVEGSSFLQTVFLCPAIYADFSCLVSA